MEDEPETYPGRVPGPTPEADVQDVSRWARAAARGLPDPVPPAEIEAQLSAAGSSKGTFGLGILALVAGAAALAGGAIAGIVVAALANGHDEPAPTARALQPFTVEQTSAVAAAAAKSRPSVVRIESSRRVNGGTEQDIGSGVVLDNDGHVITNAHVVLNTDSLRVILPDGTERPAILLGHDFPFSDVAVLQIGPGGLTPVDPGDSAALKLGETVVAIGNPLAEFDGTVSVGVVSGTNRVRTFDGVRQDDLVQTDAAVNNGNSGGALVNLLGQFVGMPTAVIRQSRSGAEVEGIAFALPSNRVIEVAHTIIKTGGQYPRPSLELEHIDLTPEVLARLNRPPVREGAVVTGVVRGGVAEAAGIQAGDVITRIGAEDINAGHPLLNAIVAARPGDTVRVVLNRNGRIIEVEVRLAQRS